MTRRPFPVERLLMDVAFTLFALFAGIVAVQSQILRVSADAAEVAPSTHAGDIMIEARWADGLDCDVDLWTQAPEDAQAVGYSRRADRQTGYVRDDTGMAADVGGLNYETAVVRGLRPGRYVADVHLYAGRGLAPVTVTVAATLVAAEGRPARQIARRVIILTHDGDEQTAFSFEVDEHEQIVPGVSTEYIPLRDPSVTR